MDEGFDVTEAQNKSHIGEEYLRYLKHGMLGHTLVVSLAQNKRISEVSKLSSEQGVKGKIEQKIFNKRDRTFLHVAFNSENRILISNDYNDFTNINRKHF